MLRSPAAILFLFLTAMSAQEQPRLPVLRQSIVITASPVEPAAEQRNGEAFRKSLFSRDDQILHLLNAGINAGQHEGGGKSIEIRRFGFNLDHGGVNGGLKILVDNIQQNYSTQGHGQGYLGALKNLSAELVDEVSIINGPFSAEYGDFSGLGVVHIRLRESLPDVLTVRMQGGSFDSKRGFVSYSPAIRNVDSFVAYDGSFSDGPFLKPLGYRRDSMTGNLTRRMADQQSFGLRWNAAANAFNSSGQLPLDLVQSGRLDRFASLDSGDGGRVRAGTLGAYYRKETDGGGVWKLDAFLSRSLFDLYSNFTFFLNDSVNGDGIQQHDSRLQQGANAQYLLPHKVHGLTALFTAGGNFHANQINVGLYPRIGRDPAGVTAADHARVTNAAGYLHDAVTLFAGKLQLGGGLRYDAFRFSVDNRLDKNGGGASHDIQLQPKANVAFTPWRRLPLTLYANYGRGISSLDARGVVRSPQDRHLATTDFYQFGSSHHFNRFSVTSSAFWIDRSNELVYIPDDGSLEFFGSSRSYGYEVKLSLALTRRLSLDAGITRVSNAFYRGTQPRLYVDRAPHFTANAGLTLAGWHGWSGSLRLRSINRYRLDREDPAILASGHTVLDLNISRPIRRGLELSLALDNMTNRSYFETQNYFESRLPGEPPRARIHATPGYPITFTAGLTFRFGGK